MSFQIKSKADVEAQMLLAKKTLHEQTTLADVAKDYPKYTDKIHNNGLLCETDDCSEISIEELEKHLAKAKANGGTHLHFYTRRDKWDDIEATEITYQIRGEENEVEYMKRLEKLREEYINEKLRTKNIELEKLLVKYVRYQELKKEFEE